MKIQRPGTPFVLKYQDIEVLIRNFNSQEKAEFASKFAKMEGDLRQVAKLELEAKKASESGENIAEVFEDVTGLLEKAGELTDMCLGDLLVDIKGVEFEDGEPFVFERDAEGRPTKETLEIVKGIPEIVSMTELIMNVGIHGKNGFQLLDAEGKAMDGVEFNPPKKKV